MNIGPIQFDRAPIALAPMEEVSDQPFRLICKRMGADIVYTEFTSSEAIIRNAPKAMNKIKLCEEERPMGIQIYGGIESSMVLAAQIAERQKPDLIDINCGCWVKKHVARNEGAGLLRDLSLFEKIVSATVKATTLPVTVKTRLGWNDESIVITDVAKMIEQTGAKALTLHCRTRCQGYKGDADWRWLEKVKKVVSIPLIGNGDVTTPQDVKRMLETGCDGVMIGRGAIQNPWIFRQTRHYLETGEILPEPDLRERVALCLEHLRLSVEERGERYGVMTFRKHYSGYLRGLSNIAHLRADLMKLESEEDIIARLRRFLEENENILLVV